VQAEAVGEHQRLVFRNGFDDRELSERHVSRTLTAKILLTNLLPF
jgi:hypothetical protein